MIVFQVGLALLKFCHDDLVSIKLLTLLLELKIKLPKNSADVNTFGSVNQVKLPFEKLIHALRNFPEDAMDPDTILPMAHAIKVFSPSFPLSCM